MAAGAAHATSMRAMYERQPPLPDLDSASSSANDHGYRVPQHQHSQATSRPTDAQAAAPHVPALQAPPTAVPWAALEVSDLHERPGAATTPWLSSGSSKHAGGGGSGGSSGGGMSGTIGGSGSWRDWLRPFSLRDLDGRVVALCAFAALMAIDTTALRATLPSYVKARFNQAPGQAPHGCLVHRRSLHGHKHSIRHSLYGQEHWGLAHPLETSCGRSATAAAQRVWVQPARFSPLNGWHATSWQGCCNYTHSMWSTANSGLRRQHGGRGRGVLRVCPGAAGVQHPCGAFGRPLRSAAAARRRAGAHGCG